MSMKATSKATPVALLNSNEDIIEILRLFFAGEGNASISGTSSTPTGTAGLRGVPDHLSAPDDRLRPCTAL